jgi:hypothetical protein
MPDKPKLTVVGEPTETGGDVPLHEEKHAGKHLMRSIEAGKFADVAEGEYVLTMATEAGIMVCTNSGSLADVTMHMDLVKLNMLTMPINPIFGGDDE